MSFPRLFPGVSAIAEPPSAGQGAFVGQQPVGVLIHYTADRDLDRARRCDNERGLGYHLVIDRKGELLQLAALDQRLYHAGPAKWRGMSCNRRFAAVSLVSWGLLAADGAAWNGAAVPLCETAIRLSNRGKELSRWDIATAPQESRLLEVVRWFLDQGIDPRNIAGHDEAALPPGRKVDPGGVLSFTMAELRETLCEERGIAPP